MKHIQENSSFLRRLPEFHSETKLSVRCLPSIGTYSW